MHVLILVTISFHTYTPYITNDQAFAIINMAENK